MWDKIKSLEPKIAALISLAPFAVGVLAGYLLRTPIGWVLGLVKLLLKL